MVIPQIYIISRCQRAANAYTVIFLRLNHTILFFYHAVMLYLPIISNKKKYNRQLTNNLVEQTSIMTNYLNLEAGPR